MKLNTKHMAPESVRQASKGFALIDVVLAIVVFAFGMLALMQLQGNFARSSADASHRTVAANMAEELVETLRGYRSITADPDNGLWDYLEIEGTALNGTVTIGGIEYTRTVAISNFWWDASNETYVRNLSATPPDGLDHLAHPSFKLLRLDVAWGIGREFNIDDDTTVDLGTGSITVYEIINSTPSALGAHLLAELEGNTGPIVEYLPGDNPDIVAIQLNDSGTRFKESTSAQPTVFHDDYVETWFDVVTYSMSANDSAEFLRREEFVAVSCQCELNDSPAEADYGRTPTLWNGVSYTEGTPESKPIGTASGNVQQSAFCDVCCRDHHDINNGGAEQVYNLANIGGSGNHPHYFRDNKGNIITTPVSTGETYVEACRLIRKDGFMRVTHDANQATLIGFPEGYLDFDLGIGNYSDYVIDSVDTYYSATNPVSFPQPNPPSNSSSYSFPARDENNSATYANLPTVTFGDNQQMRARSVYTDYLTTAARTVVAECFPANGIPSSDCAAPQALTKLEIYPFFDLQMTYLANWEDAVGNGLVTVESAAIETDDPSTIGPEYVRGLVELVDGADPGIAEVSIKSNPGNLGLTATGPIDPNYEESLDMLYISVKSGTTPVPPIGTAVSGGLSSGVKRVGIADLTLESDKALCGNSYTEWSCVVPAEGATLTVSGYYLNNPRTYVCSGLAGRTEGAGLDSTTFTLPIDGGVFDIWVTDDFSTCP